MTVKYTELAPRAADGTQLFVHRWEPEGAVAAEALILHGYAEHAGRYRELAHALAARDIASTALDFRGHGRSEGARGYISKISEYYLDVDVALAGMPDDAPRFIIAHSTGALIALDYLGQRGADIAGLIVTNPYIELALPQPAAKIWLGKVAASVYPRLSMPSGLQSDQMSKDPQMQDAHGRDPLIFPTANARWFVETLAAQQRVRALSEVAMPLFYIYSDEDPVASPSVNAEVAAKLQCPNKRVMERTGERHEVLNEVARAELHDDIATWIREQTVVALKAAGG